MKANTNFIKARVKNYKLLVLEMHSETKGETFCSKQNLSNQTTFTMIDKLPITRTDKAFSNIDKQLKSHASYSQNDATEAN